MHKNLKFNTHYNQFYIADEKSPKRTDEDEFWSNEAYDDRLAISEGIIGVGTECYGPVTGELNILTKEDDKASFDNYDHVVEGPISLTSGQLEILSSPDSKVILKIKLIPGNYRVRIYSANLKSVEGDEGDDYYKIDIWPGGNQERVVLKRYLASH